MTLSRLFIILTLCSALMLGACAPFAKNMSDPTLTLKPGEFRTEVHHYPDKDNSALALMEVYDPWEPMNRGLYKFNADLDKGVILPVTDAYKAVTPPQVRTGVKNVIQNLNEVPTFVNCVLQGKIEKSAITTGRFLINTTFGVLGLFDLASDSESLKRQDEDFGQTFGVWGFGNGPYFVMPIMGPSNLRDTAGFGADFFFLYLQMKHTYKLLGVKNTYTVGYTELLLRALNRRANTPFRYYETGSPFEYELVRFIYTKKRELDIKR